MIRRLRLPLPPSTNHLYATLPDRRRVKSRQARAYTALIGWEIRIQWGPQAWQGQGGWESYPGEVALGWAIFPCRRRDMDNLFKIVQDGLKAAGVFADDDQVAAYALWRHDKVPEAQARLELFVGPREALVHEIWPLVLQAPTARPQGGNGPDYLGPTQLP